MKERVTVHVANRRHSRERSGRRKAAETARGGSSGGRGGRLRELLLLLLLPCIATSWVRAIPSNTSSATASAVAADGRRRAGSGRRHSLTLLAGPLAVLNEPASSPMKDSSANEDETQCTETPAAEQQSRSGRARRKALNWLVSFCVLAIWSCSRPTISST